MNLVVVFGGKSCERDVSVITGLQCYKALQNTKNRVFAVYFDGKSFYSLHKFTDVSDVIGKRREVTFYNGYMRFISRRIRIDCVINACHGGDGENGALSGYFSVMGVTSTCQSVLPMCVCMSKPLAKTVARENGVRTVEGVTLSKADYSSLESLKSLIGSLTYPLIVKPSNLGSSVAVSVAHSEAELAEKLKLCFSFDDEALIERALQSFYELNVAVRVDTGELRLSAIERPRKLDEILSFKDKYASGGKKGGLSGMEREVPAKIDEQTENTVNSYAMTLYKAFKLQSVTRFDFLVENGEVYFNEANAIPGALSYYLFKETGTSFRTLLLSEVNEAIRVKSIKNELLSESPIDLIKIKEKPSRRNK